MYSSDTDAHNHVNSHVLRRITYVTCQTSHTYNTLPVLFSNLLPSSHVVAQISSLLATLLYENQQYIKGIILFMWKKVYVPDLSTAGVEVSKVCLSPWYLVLSTLFVCIRSSLHINFTSLAIISPILNENYVSITYVNLKAPGSEKKHLLSSTSSELTCNFSATNYRYCTIRKCKKNNILCVLILSYHATLLA